MPDLNGRGGAALLALPFGRRKRLVLATEGTDPASATSVENIRSADMRLVWSVAPPFFRSCGARDSVRDFYYKYAAPNGALRSARLLTISFSIEEVRSFAKAPGSISSGTTRNATHRIAPSSMPLLLSLKTGLLTKAYKHGAPNGALRHCQVCQLFNRAR